MSTKRRANKSYSPELKLDAVQKVLSGESVINVAKQLDVVDPDYIYKWIEKYNIYGEVELKRKVRNHPQLDKDYVIQELEMENELFKKVSSNSAQGGKTIKFKVIDELKHKYPIVKLCEKLQVSKAGYYKYRQAKGKKRKKSSKDKQLTEYITIIYHQHHKNYGYRV